MEKRIKTCDLCDCQENLRAVGCQDICIDCLKEHPVYVFAQKELLEELMDDCIKIESEEGRGYGVHRGHLKRKLVALNQTED